MTRIRAKMVQEKMRELTILRTCLVTEILAAFNFSRTPASQSLVDDDTWSRNNERSGWLESALATDDLFSFVSMFSECSEFATAAARCTTEKSKKMPRNK